jgi:SAM-dependent methyltransferase
MMDPTQRFSNRVEDYARYRPGYPAEVLDKMRQEMGLTPAAVIADVGCGTGILSRLFCEAGNRVYGVEPNVAMLDAARESLRRFPQFIPLAARAEATTLPEHSIDMVTAAQAFHWFDPQEARREFLRVLKPGGWVVLLWNERRLDATPFMIAYEEFLMHFGIDYARVKRSWEKSALPEFFAPAGFRTAVIDNPQWFDRHGLTGRILSASYMPHRGHATYPAMLGAIDNLFDEYQSGGHVRLEQETRMFYGQLVEPFTR